MGYLIHLLGGTYRVPDASERVRSSTARKVLRALALTTFARTSSPTYSPPSSGEPVWMDCKDLRNLAGLTTNKSLVDAFNVIGKAFPGLLITKNGRNVPRQDFQVALCDLGAIDIFSMFDQHSSALTRRSLRSARDHLYRLAIETNSILGPTKGPTVPERNRSGSTPFELGGPLRQAERPKKSTLQAYDDGLQASIRLPLDIVRDYALAEYILNDWKTLVRELPAWYRHLHDDDPLREWYAEALTVFNIFFMPSRNYFDGIRGEPGRDFPTIDEGVSITTTHGRQRRHGWVDEFLDRSLAFESLRRLPADPRLITKRAKLHAADHQIAMLLHSLETQKRLGFQDLSDFAARVSAASASSEALEMLSENLAQWTIDADNGPEARTMSAAAISHLPTRQRDLAMATLGHGHDHHARLLVQALQGGRALVLPDDESISKALSDIWSGTCSAIREAQHATLEGELGVAG